MKPKDVQDRIIDLANLREMSLYKLAQLSGVSFSGIYNIRSRKNMPKIETLQKLGEALGVDVSDLLADPSRVKAGGYITKNEENLLRYNRTLSEKEKAELLRYAKYLSLEHKHNDES